MNNTELKRSTARALATADYSPTRLVLIHSGVTLLVTGLSAFVSYLLTRKIDATTGLTALNTRTILTMAQMILNLATTVLLPFWSVGILRAAMDYARGNSVTPGCLLEGFRRWGVVLRLFLLRFLLAVIICIACMQAATTLFMLTPWSEKLLTQMEQLLPAMDSASMLNPQLTDPTAIDPEIIYGLLPYLAPIYVLAGSGIAVLAVLTMYRLRLADYMVLDGHDKAFAALRQSMRAMKGKKAQLFRLDLSYWWYFALQLLCIAVAYGDKLLPALGISMNADVAFWLFYGVSLVAQLVINCAFAPKVQTTYAMFYEQLRIKN